MAVMTLVNEYCKLVDYLNTFFIEFVQLNMLRKPIKRIMNLWSSRHL